jgi:hypothetical protein
VPRITLLLKTIKGGANSNILYHKNIIDNIHINRPSDHPISLEFNPANNKLYAES